MVSQQSGPYDWVASPQALAKKLKTVLLRRSRRSQTTSEKLRTTNEEPADPTSDHRLLTTDL